MSSYIKAIFNRVQYGEYIYVYIYIYIYICVCVLGLGCCVDAVWRNE